MPRHSDAKHTKIDHPATHYEKPGNIPGDKALSDEDKGEGAQHVGTRCASIDGR